MCISRRSGETIISVLSFIRRIAFAVLWRHSALLACSRRDEQIILLNPGRGTIFHKRVHICAVLGQSLTVMATVGSFLQRLYALPSRLGGIKATGLDSNIHYSTLVPLLLLLLLATENKKLNCRRELARCSMSYVTSTYRVD